jgi:hypothetical protein
LYPATPRDDLKVRFQEIVASSSPGMQLPWDLKPKLSCSVRSQPDDSLSKERLDVHVATLPPEDREIVLVDDCQY